MKLAKKQLVKYQENPLLLDTELDLAALAQERFPDLILEISPLKVIGKVQYDASDIVSLNVQVSGEVVLPSTRSMEPVALAINLGIQERYVGKPEQLDQFEEDEAVFLLENDQLDVDQVILDNLVAMFPSQVLTPAEAANQEFPKGNDWQVISESNYDEQPAQVLEDVEDPRWAKLNDFFEK
ncbi:DUF177 domain-containing protein [Convivina intestini]|uniref:DUF177 domain-containing protein n=1 Tax=Convivina intestini TaxID=1505726 RepID=A0A2U1DBT1_9LACO|nr:YceD family protein [Convivina intestini]PVY85106.1 uncharacterized protein C7384_103131 [Convivina intestini]CAH1853771.1 hypothetical protein R077811_00783 [Convivina intestini]SDB88519.1 uncharacterized protein SAMN05216341_10323 [Leuconostocaceae bacterium R-53105]